MDLSRGNVSDVILSPRHFSHATLKTGSGLGTRLITAECLSMKATNTALKLTKMYYVDVLVMLWNASTRQQSMRLGSTY